MLRKLTMAGSLFAAALSLSPQSASAAPAGPQPALSGTVGIQTVQYYGGYGYRRPYGYRRDFYGPRRYNRQRYYGRRYYNPRPYGYGYGGPPRFYFGF